MPEMGQNVTFDSKNDENDVKMINADTRNYSDLSVIFEQYKPTKVIHLSAISSAIKARQNPSLCFDIQLMLNLTFLDMEIYETFILLVFIYFFL